MMKETDQDIARFYELMATLEDGLGGKRLFRECNGGQTWSKRGVYIIFENCENRFERSKEMRVTRIGTHAIREGEGSNLWGRLRHHKGTANGGGNHRGSVFRRHLGSALINRSSGTLSYPSWNKKDPTAEERSTEKALEKQVSDYIGGSYLLWLNIDDVPSPLSDRAYLEKHSIALLANPINKDHASKDWLGNYSSRQEIKLSGLWNVDHVGQPYDPLFLDTFEKYVRSTITKS